MLDRGLREQINSVIGKELRGKLNETLLLILLIKNYTAAEESKKIRSRGFRGRKDRRIVKEGLTTRVIAEELDIPQSTIATAVSRLAKRGLVVHSKGMPIKTTKEGRDIANEKLRHHRMLEVLLANSLGLTPDDAHNESVKLMLLASCDLIKSISKRYSDPRICPCGENIPPSSACKS